VIIVLLAIFSIKKFGAFNLSGLSKKFKWTNKFLAIIPIYLIIIGGLSLLSMDLSGTKPIDLILLFFEKMFVGFSEEFVFRGLICAILVKEFIHKKNGILLSILIPALLFGVLHILNFKIENIASEISQLLYAIYFGVFFGAVLLRTNRLIPIAIIHGLIDFVFSFDSLLGEELSKESLDSASESISAIVSSVLVLPLLIIGFLIIKKIKKEDILAKITLLNNA
jgi:membrane protease YdiL (CAAX protease family)